MPDQQTNNPEDDHSQATGGLTEEFGDLGKNLVGILRAAWERPERQKLQQEIEGGLSELGTTLRKEARAVAENPVSQRIKSEVGDLGSKVRSGQVEGKVREELVSALHVVNVELQKIANILAVGEAETIIETDFTEQDSGAQTSPPDSEVSAGKDQDNQPGTINTLDTLATETASQTAGDANVETHPGTDTQAEA